MLQDMIKTEERIKTHRSSTLGGSKINDGVSSIRNWAQNFIETSH